MKLAVSYCILGIVYENYFFRTPVTRLLAWFVNWAGIAGVCYDNFLDEECVDILVLFPWPPHYEETCITFPNTRYKAADYQYDLGCDGGDFDGGIADPNGCYSYPTGYTHNSLLPVNIPGVCFQYADAQFEGDFSFICNDDEFLDLGSGDCYACGLGQSYNPLFGADEQGVCFAQDETVAVSGGEEGFICPIGSFLDSVTGNCYSCPEDYDWNPSEPITDVAACVNWDSLAVEQENPDFEVGYEIDYDIKHIEGIEGGINTDPGSVNIDYTPSVKIEIEPVDSDDGNEHFIISTREISDNSDLKMSTTWPHVYMFLDTYSSIDYTVTGNVKHLEHSATEGWTAKNTMHDIFDKSSGEETHPSEDGPLLEFGIGAAGIGLGTNSDGGFNILGENYLGLAWPDYGEGYQFGFDPPIELTNQFFISGGLDYIGTPVVEFGLTGPIMDTPPQNTVDVLDRGQFKSIFTKEVNIGSDSGDTTIKHKIVSNSRDDISRLVVGSSAQDTDIARVNIDLDGIASAIKFGGVAALGYKFSWPSPVLLINWASLSLSMFDLDVANIFSIHQELEFKSKLTVDLSFSVPVLMRSSSETSFIRRNTFTVLGVGAENGQLEFIHPGGELTITPSYSVKSNEFINNTDLVWIPILEGEMLSAELKVLGVSKDVIPKSTVLKFSGEIVRDPDTFEPLPVKLVDMNFYDDPFTFAEWLIFTPGLEGLSGTELNEKYNEYRLEEIDKASFSLQGFEKQTGDAIVIQGSNNAPIARCQSVDLALDNAGQGQVNAQAIDNGSTDSDGGPVSSMNLDPSVFSCNDIGSPTVTLTVLDEAGAEASCEASVNVRDNLAPVGAMPAPFTLSEGEAYQFEDLGVTDNCGNVAYEWTFPNGRESSNPTPLHQFCLLGAQEINLEILDGNARFESIFVHVDNLPPIVEAGEEINGLEGQAISLISARFSDGGLFAHSASVDWGDGSPSQTISLLPPAESTCGMNVNLNASHTYIDDGHYTVTVEVNDGKGGIHTHTTAAVIANQAPTITQLEPTARTDSLYGDEDSFFLYSGETFEFAMNYMDAGGNDSHTLTVDWKEAGTSSSVFNLGVVSDGGGEISGQHTFYQPGRYSILFDLQDNAGAHKTQEVSLEVKPLTVQMDFMTSDDENLVEEGLHGPIPVVLFAGEHETGPYSTEQIDIDTLLLGPGQAQVHRKIYDLILFEIEGNAITQFEDFNADGDGDVKIWFDAVDSGISPEDRSISLSGTFIDGRYFVARDGVNIAASRALFQAILPSILLLLED